MGLDLETVQLEVEKHVPPGPDHKVAGTIPYTPRVKKVLDLASKEARQLAHTYVGTEHILMGLLREGNGVAAKVLRGLDIDLEQTRNEILKEVDPNFQGGEDFANMEEAGKPEKKGEIKTPRSRHLVATSRKLPAKGLWTRLLVARMR